MPRPYMATCLVHITHVKEFMSGPVVCSEEAQIPSKLPGKWAGGPALPRILREGGQNSTYCPEKSGAPERTSALPLRNPATL